MRIVVAPDRMGSLSSSRAGIALALGWEGADVTVVPLGEAGEGFVEAAADQLGAEPLSTVLGERVVTRAHGRGTTVLGVENARTIEESSAIAVNASSVDLGLAVRQGLEQAPGPDRLVVDLTGTGAHDGGAGFLWALGAQSDVVLSEGVAALKAAGRLDLSRVRTRLAGVDLVGVVPTDEISQSLLGLRGITSMRGRGSSTEQVELLDIDAALATFARLTAPDQTAQPGAGACGGLGFAILALGGRLVTGPRYGLQSGAGHRGYGAVDLVVTGCTVFDFARRGGGVVAEAARLGVDQLSPCIAVAIEVLIGGREMRTMGIESAYAVRESTSPSPGGSDVTEWELSATARRVGRSWRW